jgi:integral membrane protein
MRLLTTSLGRLRLIGWFEGASFLLLLGVAMPLKYIWGQPEWVRGIGMAHGVLFLAYLAAALQVTLDEQWPLKRAILVMAASLLPFGTFYADVKWLRPASSAHSNKAGTR